MSDGVIASVMVAGVFSTCARCVSACLSTVLASVLRTVPLDVAVEFAEATLLVLVDFAWLPHRIPFHVVRFGVDAIMRALAAPSWVFCAVALIQGSELSFLRRDDDWWGFGDALSKLVVGRHRHLEGFYPLRISFAHETDGNFSYMAFGLSRHTYGEVHKSLLVFLLTRVEFGHSNDVVFKLLVDFRCFTSEFLDVFLGVSIMFVKEESFVKSGVVCRLSDKLRDVLCQVCRVTESSIIQGILEVVIFGDGQRFWLLRTR